MSETEPTAGSMSSDDVTTTGAPANEPIDLVYLWVDGADPAFRALKAKYRGEGPKRDDRPELTGDEARWLQMGEISWSVASARRFAPWIRTIFIVVKPGQKPPVDLADPRIRVVEEPEIQPAELFPVFASRSIEPFIHRIPGLSEIFVYGNDDFVFWRPTPRDHFVADGRLSLRGRIQPLWRAKIDAARHKGHTRIVNLTALLLYARGFRRVHKPEHAFHVMRRATCERVWAEVGDRLSKAVALRFRDDDNGLNWQTLVNSFELRDRDPRLVRTFNAVLLSFAHVEESAVMAFYIRLRLAMLRWGLFVPRTLCFNTIPAAWQGRVRAIFERHFGRLDETARARDDEAEGLSV